MRADYLKAANALKRNCGADDSYFLYTEDIFGDVLNHLATAHQHSFMDGLLIPYYSPDHHTLYNYTIDLFVIAGIRLTLRILFSKVAVV